MAVMRKEPCSRCGKVKDIWRGYRGRSQFNTLCEDCKKKIKEPKKVSFLQGCSNFINNIKKMWRLG